MFRINNGKGFFVEFPNKYGVSVQFGYGNYSSNRGDNLPFPIDWEVTNRKLGEEGALTAEIAVIDPQGNLTGQELGIFEGDSVEGWCDATRVLEVLNLVAALP